MTLGILPNLGDSFINYAKSGRDSHWENNYLRFYKQKYSKIAFFSYADEPNPYPETLTFYANKSHFSRFIYTFLLPFYYFKQLRSFQVLRVRQMPGCVPAVMAKILFGKPYLATYGYDYAYFAKKDGKYFLAPLIKIIEFIGIKFADAVVVTSSQMHKKISAVCKPEKIHLIPNGVDIKLFKPVNNGKNNNIKTILSVGRLVSQKNFNILINACALVSSKFKTKLIIVGSGPLKEKLQKLALEKKVDLEIIPAKSYYKMPEVYNRADIFVLASFYEGSPKVLLEAMSCGLPVVASNQDYSRFIIKSGENGLLVDSESSLMASKIQYLLENRKAAKTLGDRARENIAKNFNNQESLNKEMAILNKIRKC